MFSGDGTADSCSQSFAVSGSGILLPCSRRSCVKPQEKRPIFQLYRRRQQRVSAVISNVDNAQQMAMPKMHRLRKNSPNTNILIPPLRFLGVARVCANSRLPKQTLLPVYARPGSCGRQSVINGSGRRVLSPRPQAGMGTPLPHGPADGNFADGNR